MKPLHPNTIVPNEDETSINGYDDVIPANNDKYDATNMNYDFLDNSHHIEVHIDENIIVE